MNRTVVITGGTSGIGKEVGKLFKQAGDEVFLLGLNPDPLDKDEYYCDVTDVPAFANSVASIIKLRGKIDVLICSAGYGVSGAVELSSEQEIKKLFDVNYFGVLNSCRLCLPHMQKGGKIVIIGSVCAIFPMPFRSQYCASKAAVNMLSHGLKMELKGSGIEVCVINPGDVKTPFITNRVKNFQTNERYKQRVEKAQEKVDKNNDKRMSVEYAGKKIYKIASKRKFKAEYIIGRKYKFFNFLIRIFPINCFLKVLNRIFGGF